MDHLLDDEEMPRHERELTLSTGAILGIFLGLAVLCGAFFGFGYNMGRKSAPTPLSLSEINNDAATLPASTATPKPSAGTPLSGEGATTTAAPLPVPRPIRRPPPTPVATDENTTGPEANSSIPAPASRPPSTHAATAPAVPAAAPIVRQPALISPSALSPSSSPGPGASGTGSFMVQVAAVSHQEDADLLVGALRSRGYAVSARPATADKFIHVQVGPFRDKKEADAMKQRLLTDGYNAIVK